MVKEKTKLNPRSYLTILPWMVEELGLENTDLLIYAIIYGFCQDGESDYHGGLEFLMKWTNKTDRAIRNSLNSLVERGLLKKKIVGYNKATYTAIFSEDAEESSADMRKKVPHDAEKSSAHMRKKVPHDAEKSSANNKYNNKYRYSKENKDEKITPIKHKEDKTSTMDNQWTTNGQPMDGIGEDRIGKVSLERESPLTFQTVLDLYHDICVSYPKLRKLSTARQKRINARINNFTLDDFRLLFEKAEASDFLKGKNDRGWSANFDWMTNENNMLKVLEGNYDNKSSPKNKQSNQFNNFPQRDNVDFDELERKMTGGTRC